jgi:hypothetical protein
LMVMRYYIDPYAIPAHSIREGVGLCAFHRINMRWFGGEMQLVLFIT